MSKIKEGMDYAVGGEGQHRQGPPQQMNRGPIPRALQARIQTRNEIKAVSQFRELLQSESEGKTDEDVELLRTRVRRHLYVPPDGKDVSTNGRLGSGEVHSHQSSVNDYNSR